ncbi:MAG TPA: hypothetical protein VGD37_06210 [Kofleriaceae bacterium]
MSTSTSGKVKLAGEHVELGDRRRPELERAPRGTIGAAYDELAGDAVADQTPALQSLASSRVRHPKRREARSVARIDLPSSTRRRSA